MMRFDKFTEQAQEAARRSYEVMQRYGHTQVDVEHIFLALLEQPQGSDRRDAGADGRADRDHEGAAGR